jgi:hypothetical protein
MRTLFVAILFAGAVLGVRAADAADGCGPGCHSAPLGGCVVDGWGILPPGTRNECPAGSRAVPPCPHGYVWRFKACFPA